MLSIMTIVRTPPLRRRKTRGSSFPRPGRFRGRRLCRGEIDRGPVSKPLPPDERGLYLQTHAIAARPRCRTARLNSRGSCACWRHISRGKLRQGLRAISPRGQKHPVQLALRLVRRAPKYPGRARHRRDATRIQTSGQLHPQREPADHFARPPRPTRSKTRARSPRSSPPVVVAASRVSSFLPAQVSRSQSAAVPRDRPRRRSSSTTSAIEIVRNGAGRDRLYRVLVPAAGMGRTPYIGFTSGRPSFRSPRAPRYPGVPRERQCASYKRAGPQRQSLQRRASRYIGQCAGRPTRCAARGGGSSSTRIKKGGNACRFPPKKLARIRRLISPPPEFERPCRDEMPAVEADFPGDPTVSPAHRAKGPYAIVHDSR